MKYIVIILMLSLCMTSTTYAAPTFGDITPQSSTCSDMGDCLTGVQNCTEPCGCNNWYYYKKATNQCLLNLDYIREIMTEKYNTQETIRQNAEKVFGGILVAVYFFISCVILCTLSACFYCCRLHYSDHKLNADVKALAEKVQRDGKLLKKPEKKKTAPVAESCNVCVDDAGLFVC